MCDKKSMKRFCDVRIGDEIYYIGKGGVVTGVLISGVEDVNLKHENILLKVANSTNVYWLPYDGTKCEFEELTLFSCIEAAHEEFYNQQFNLIQKEIVTKFYNEKSRSMMLMFNRVEVKSNLNRVRNAEGLILQLPEDHDGRNTWLLNYGSGEEAVKMREERGIKWDDKTQSAELKTD